MEKEAQKVIEAAATLQPLHLLPPAALPPPAAAPAQEPPQQPSQDYSSVSASPSPPDSPKIYCSQLRQAQHDEQSDKEMIAITVDEKVSDWLQRNEIDLNTALFVVDDDEQVHICKDHRNREGQAPLCYVETGYKGTPAPDGEPHQAYMVYNKSDLEWARRLRFHLRRFQP